MGNKINVVNDTRIIGGSFHKSINNILYYEFFGLTEFDDTFGGTPFYNIPFGWVRNTYHVTCYGNNDVIPFCDINGSSSNTFLYFHNWNEINNGLLTTSAISTIGKTNIKLNFNEYRGYSGTLLPPPLTLEYSPNNGSTWSAITWTETTTQITWVNSGDILLPNGAENKSQLKIRFKLNSNGNNELIAIDDFKIYTNN